MKHQGKILNWNDDKGYGFVEPDGGGARAFVHIKAFKPRSRRPINGETIVYDLVRENNDRCKAANIQFANDAKSVKKRDRVTSGSRFGSVFTIIFLAALCASTAIGKLPVIVAGAYIVMSLITFIAYAIDKSAAKKGRWRTQESTLHLFALIGGWPGAFFAQNILRHKSRKAAFKRVYWLTVIVNLAGFAWLHTEEGISFINNVVLPFLERII